MVSASILYSAEMFANISVLYILNTFFPHHIIQLTVYLTHPLKCLVKVVVTLGIVKHLT